MTTKKYMPGNKDGKTSEVSQRPTVQHGSHPERTATSTEHHVALFYKERISHLEEALRDKNSVIGILEKEKSGLMETIAFAAIREHHTDQEKAKLARENAQLKHDYDHLKKFAYVDERTGLERAEIFNNLGFPKAFGTAMRHDLNLVLVIIDLNNLKVTNDTKSYEHGNKLLAHTAKAISETIRREDSKFKFEEGYRWGGDEFVVLANIPKGKPEEVHTSAKALVSRLESAMAASNIDCAIGACVMVRHSEAHARYDDKLMISYAEKPVMNADNLIISKADVGMIRDRMFKNAERQMKKDKAHKKGKPISDLKRE